MIKLSRDREGAVKTEIMRSVGIHSQNSDGGGGAGRAQSETGGRYADGTIGGGGHAERILDASSPTGWLYGFDRDGAAVEAARQRLDRRFAGRFEIRRGEFFGNGRLGARGSCDGVILDLGVSSPQLDSAQRGFSFQSHGPLDMRMDDRQTLTAADLVNAASAEDLADIFWRFGGERDSRRFARAIAHDRAQRKFETTEQLADLIERLAPRGGKNASGHESVSGVARSGER